MPRGPLVIKSDGSKEPFDPRKLRDSLVSARASMEVADEIVASITAEIRPNDTTARIYQAAHKMLARRERHVASRYGMRRSILDLGPTGFPFEKFVGELYRAEGYSVMVGEMMYGSCVSHEVDVVAWNDVDLIALEAKFHNDLAFKTDTKVVLYVKARVEDLQTHAHKIGGKSRMVTRGAIATNTKFTDTAETYAACVGMELLSWETPRGDNLYDRMSRHGIFPVSSLTSLKTHEKRAIAESGIVDTKTLAAEEKTLRGVLRDDPVRVADVLSEISEMVRHFSEGE
jgi:Holliday junction resolvase